MFFPGKKKIPSKKITNSQHVLVVPNLQSLIPPLTSALNSGTRFSLHSSSSPFSALQLFRFLLRFFLSIRVSIFFSFFVFFREQGWTFSPWVKVYGKLGFWLKACRTAGHDICQGVGLASGSGIKGMSHIISMTHTQQ